MSSVGMRRRAAVLFVPWLLAACHCYAATSVSALPADARVRVALTERASVDLASTLGPRTRHLRGRIVERADSALVLRVTAVQRDGANEESWRGEAVRLPLAAVAGVERDGLSRSRTGLFAGGLVAALALAVAVLGGSGSDTVTGGPGGRQPGGER
jgi:hypothetical protein